MRYRIKRQLLACATVVLIMTITVLMGVVMCQTFAEIRQRESDHLLHFYSEKVMLQLRETLNEAASLAQTANVLKAGDTMWFESAVAPLMEREEVCYVCLIEGDTVVSALPKSEYGNQVGRDLKDFSYIYTMAKVVKELVVEGPVTMEGVADDQQVFLFLQPFVEDNSYLGEVVVALDRDYVMTQLGLDYLSDNGYDYELWRVESQNGGKEVVAVSRANVDFSHAVKTIFYLPTQWNLSIQPMNGWVSPSNRAWIVSICFTFAVLMLIIVYSLCKLTGQSRILKRLDSTDRQTGLYNQLGFTEALEHWIGEDRCSVTLFYFVFEGYNQVSQLIGPVKESEFLQSIPVRLKNFIKNKFIAGRLGAGNFILAVREDMDDIEQEDFARGLSLELILKINFNGKKSFLTASYQYRRCKPDGFRANEEIASIIKDYYTQRSEESPAHKLAEKCRQLIEGKNDVMFDEYTDLEMMELSKTFNQYRKNVEQLAYFDPVFNIGNRPKYLRDANMLISYDKKRQFSLFCVDICDFSQYNQLFSVDIGDEILHEVVRRLSRLFGTHLYRINGDVFLGISLSEENAESFSSKLQNLFVGPVSVRNASFELQIRIAVCQYPTNGDRPEELLDHIQSAMRYAKESDRKTVFYNDTIDEIIRTETDILHRLRDAIRQETLEVWYQPMVNVETGQFTAAEALIRLPYGSGGYFSAAQVVSLAERSGTVDQLGDYVLRKACQFMYCYGSKLGLTHMGVNISVQQLLLGNSVDHLLNIIQASGVKADQITLEITESILIQSIERASSSLDMLRKIGIHIALDDFGVGYSSLNYLSNLPVDVIKIDRSLTQQIRTSQKQRALLHSIVEMAGINSLTVVAEGVETEEEQKLISSSGVEYIQGFYYAKPMKREELISFLEEKKAESR